MLTEEGYIGTENIPVAPALNKYRKKLKIIALISLISGAAGLIAYIVGSVLEMKDGEAPRWVDIFLVFAVPFAIGLVGNIVLIRLHSREKAEGVTSSCSFYADCFVCNCKGTHNIAETVEKFVYSDAVLKGENEQYGYIFTKSGQFLVFSKEGLNEEELNAIYKNFGKPVDGAAAELKTHPPKEEN